MTDTGDSKVVALTGKGVVEGGGQKEAVAKTSEGGEQQLPFVAPPEEKPGGGDESADGKSRGESGKTIVTDTGDSKVAAVTGEGVVEGGGQKKAVSKTSEGGEQQLPFVAPPEGETGAGDESADDKSPGESGKLSEADVARIGDMFKLVVADMQDVNVEIGAKLTTLENRVEAAGEQVADSLRIYTADFHRWRELHGPPWKWLTVAAVAVAVPVLFGFGVLIEQQFQIVAIEDPTGGWRDHVWDNYGRKLVDCITEATRTDGEVSCSIIVSKP